MNDIIEDLKYFDAYARECVERTNKLARISAKRELVMTATKIMQHPEYEVLLDERKRQIARTYLTYTAELCTIDEHIDGSGDAAKVIAHQIDLRKRVDYEVKLNAAIRRVDKEKDDEQRRFLRGIFGS